MALALSGCATGEAPRVPPPAKAMGSFLPSCLFFCIATGGATQAEHGDATQTGDLSTSAAVSPPPPKPKKRR